MRGLLGLTSSSCPSRDAESLYSVISVTGLPLNPCLPCKEGNEVFPLEGKECQVITHLEMAIAQTW